MAVQNLGGSFMILLPPVRCQITLCDKLILSEVKVAVLRYSDDIFSKGGSRLGLGFEFFLFIWLSLFLHLLTLVALQPFSYHYFDSFCSKWKH